MDTGYIINGIKLELGHNVVFRKLHYAESYQARVTHIFLDNTVKVALGNNSTIVAISEIQGIVIPDSIPQQYWKEPIKEDKKAAVASTKPQLQLIPSYFSEELARVMQNGKEKYGERNWITGDGVSLQTYLGAILRHTNKIISGEDIDPESGLEHAAHIAASCAIILDAKQCGKLKDDRILPKCYDLPNPGSPIRD